MKEQEVFQTIKEFARKLPKFPGGRIDYSCSKVAPVLTIFIRYKNEILLLKRSDKVKVYQGRWNAIAGYLDELKPLFDKILEELKEELGMDKNNILAIYFGQPHEVKDKSINKTWLVHPALVELKNKPEIKLDWENVEYKWINPCELKRFDTVPKLKESLKRVLKMP